MSQEFEDLLRQCHYAQQKQKRLAAEIKPEWDVLKGLVSQLAADNKGIGEDRFRWSKTASGQPSLVLGQVAATFSVLADRSGTPQSCKVRFSRKDGVSVIKPLLADQTWSLTPEILKGEFAWAIREVGQVFSPSQLAEEIATELTRYHLSYEKQGQKAFGT